MAFQLAAFHPLLLELHLFVQTYLCCGILSFAEFSFPGLELLIFPAFHPFDRGASQHYNLSLRVAPMEKLLWT